MGTKKQIIILFDTRYADIENKRSSNSPWTRKINKSISSSKLQKQQDQKKIQNHEDDGKNIYGQRGLTGRFKSKIHHHHQHQVQPQQKEQKQQQRRKADQL